MLMFKRKKNTTMYCTSSSTCIVYYFAQCIMSHCKLSYMYARVKLKKNNRLKNCVILCILIFYHKHYIFFFIILTQIAIDLALLIDRKQFVFFCIYLSEHHCFGILIYTNKRVFVLLIKKFEKLCVSR